MRLFVINNQNYKLQKVGTQSKERIMGWTEILLIVACVAIVSSVVVTSVVRKHKRKKNGGCGGGCGGSCDGCPYCDHK